MIESIIIEPYHIPSSLIEPYIIKV